MDWGVGRPPVGGGDGCWGGVSKAVSVVFGRRDPPPSGWGWGFPWRWVYCYWGSGSLKWCMSCADVFPRIIVSVLCRHTVNEEMSMWAGGQHRRQWKLSGGGKRVKNDPPPHLDPRCRTTQCHDCHAFKALERPARAGLRRVPLSVPGPGNWAACPSDVLAWHFRDKQSVWGTGDHRVSRRARRPSQACDELFFGHRCPPPPPAPDQSDRRGTKRNLPTGKYHRALFGTQTFGSQNPPPPPPNTPFKHSPGPSSKLQPTWASRA